MLRIGLTGGIAAGKSVASRRFEQLGARVVDHDGCQLIDGTALVIVGVIVGVIVLMVDMVVIPKLSLVCQPAGIRSAWHVRCFLIPRPRRLTPVLKNGCIRIRRSR